MIDINDVNVVIIASGLGTRMQKITGGLYPKLFATIGKQTLFDRMIQNCRYAKSITVVGNERTVNAAKEHVERYYKDMICFNTFVHEDTDGSWSAIADIAKFQMKNVLFHWSDITTNLKILFENIEDNDKIIFCKDGEYRYRLLPIGAIVKDKCGNIPGLFFIKDTKDIYAPSKPGEDFVEYLSEQKDLSSYYINGELLDNGDFEKHKRVMENAEIESRAFNSISFTENSVIKQALDSHGQKIQKFEYNFYKENKRFQGSILPKVIKYEEVIGRLVLEKLDGFITLHEFIKQNNKDFNKIEYVIKKAREVLEKLHTSKSYQSYRCGEKTDIEEEFYKSMIGRTLEVQHLLSENLSINCRRPKLPFGALIIQWKTWIKSCEFEFSECHGDPNSSNIMVHPQTLEIKLIDPRGYFGKNTKTSPIIYDEAKFIYGLHAYSDLNLLKIPIIENPDNENTRNFNMRDIHSFDLDILLDILYPGDSIYQSQIKMFVGLIFIKLTGYIKNDPTKSNIAYIYGRILMEDGLHELGII